MTPLESNDASNKFRPEVKLDDQLQKELDDALGDMSLADLIDAEQESAPTPAKTAGEGVKRGRVLDIQRDAIFVDMGGKSQGLLSSRQFDEDEPLPQIGDMVEVTIEGYNAAEGLLMLSRKGAVMAAAWETIGEGQIVEGRVTGHNKGGLELTINNIRAFMPISQIEMFRVEDISPYVDQKFKCQVIEVDRADRNVIVSRRAMLEFEAEQMREHIWETLEEGKVVAGVVRSIMPYGAFVDIGGIDGLLHIRDMSHVRIEDPKEIVSEGLQVQVKILSIDRDEQRISLGLKQTMPDPWLGADTKWLTNTVVSGRITRVMDFGAFVELEPGVEGLVPISELTFERRVNHPNEIVTEGEVTKVRIMTVDVQAKRISLSIKRIGDDPWIGASFRWPEGSIVSGIVTRVADFGAFVELTGGVEGMVHISELSLDRVRAVTDVVNQGDRVEAKVLSVDEQARRMSLSISKCATASESVEIQDDQPAPPPRKRKNPLKGGLE